MYLHEIVPGSKEEEEISRRILTNLYEAWAWDHGLTVESLRITFDREPKEAVT